MSLCCPLPTPGCGMDEAHACLVGDDDGTPAVQVNVAANVLGLSRGQVGVWVRGSAVHVYVEGHYLVPATP